MQMFLALVNNTYESKYQVEDEMKGKLVKLILTNE